MLYGRIDILVNNAFDPSAVFLSVIDLSVEKPQRFYLPRAAAGGRGCNPPPAVL